jgi:hypothetical protein
VYGDVDVKDPGIQIPSSVYPLMNIYMRDTQVTRGRDGWFFLTGSVAAPGQPSKGAMWNWKWNDGIRVWKSRDLKEWEPLGLVWSLDECDGWPRDFYVYPPGEAGYILSPDDFCQTELPAGTEVRRSAWAPEVHYLPLQDNYFLVGCVNHNMLLGKHEPVGHGFKGATFVLRSTTGEPEGPYELISPDAPLTAQIDANLFEDDDGEIYLVYQNGKIARLKDDLTGLAEEPKFLSQQSYSNEPYMEGTFLFKRNGKYFLSNTVWSSPDPERPGTFQYERKNGVYSYDAVIASSDSIYGPYGERTTALIGGGHGNFFEDFDGQWWACIFWNPRGGFAETWDTICRPALVPMQWEGDRMFTDYIAAAEFYTEENHSASDGFSVKGNPADREIGKNGSLRDLQYFGVGDFRGIDLCGAVLFELPVLPEGEVVTNANLSFYVRTVGELSFNADLYGIGFGDESAISGSLYYAGDFLADENGHVGLQDNVLTPSVTDGVHASDDISTWVQSYYTSNPDYSGGTYVIFRFNADVEAVSTNIRYEIGQANNATVGRQPSLILMTGGSGRR